MSLESVINSVAQAPRVRFCPARHADDFVEQGVRALNSILLELDPVPDVEISLNEDLQGNKYGLVNLRQADAQILLRCLVTHEQFERHLMFVQLLSEHTPQWNVNIVCEPDRVSKIVAEFIKEFGDCD